VLGAHPSCSMNGGSVVFLAHAKPLGFEKFKPLATCTVEEQGRPSHPIVTMTDIAQVPSSTVVIVQGSNDI